MEVPMSDINVHDHFFRSLLSDPAKARLFLQEVLPPDLQQELDLSGLSFDKESHVKPDLRARFSDLVIHTRMRDRRADIYILMEHKSAPDAGVWLQIMEYQLALWQRDRQAKRLLTPVIPLVFYHGRRRWQIPCEFSGQFDVPASALPFLPRYRYILFDTAGWDMTGAGRLRENIFLLSGLMLLKHAWGRDLDALAKIIALWRDLGYINTKDEVCIQLQYIIRTRDIPLETLDNLVQETLKSKEAIMPTLAERLIEKGKIEGIAAGKVEGKAEGKAEGLQVTLIRQLERKFGIDDSQRTQVAGCRDCAKLATALDEILEATEAGAVLRHLL
jgi:predicted transposase/invertase (TIGR01784 family)